MNSKKLLRFIYYSSKTTVMAFQKTRIIYMLKEDELQINLSGYDLNPQRVFDITELLQRFRFEYSEIAKEYGEGEGEEERLFGEQIYAQMTETERPAYRMFFLECRTEPQADRIFTLLRNKANFPEIAFLQYDEEVGLHHQPNDPRYPETWGMAKIEMEKAWDGETTFGKDIVIAVVDTGIDYNHPDISGSMLRDSLGNIIGIDVANKDNDPMDTSGHGSHVAGIIAATIDNGQGVAGVAPNAKLMAVKIFPDGSRTTSDMNTFKGLKYAADSEARIICNSWGPTQRRPSNIGLEIMINYAYSKGSIVVFSAGNLGDDVFYYCPANHPNVICVAATDQQDNRSVWPGGFASNYGDNVTIAAPGSDILSLQNNTPGYVSKNGTSMACPHVVGVIALMEKAKNLLPLPEKLTTEKAKYCLWKSVDAINPDQYIGWGRLNAFKAVEQAKKPTQVVAILVVFNLTDDDKDKEEEIQLTVSKTGIPGAIGFGRFGRGTKWRDPGPYHCKVKVLAFNETELDQITVRMYKTPHPAGTTGCGMEGSIQFYAVYEGGFSERNLNVPERRYGDNNPYDVTFSLINI